jgi:hypothetical protein
MCRLLHQARTRLTQRPGGTQGLKALNMSQREQLTAAGACFLLPPPITLPARAAALPPPCAFLHRRAFRVPTRFFGRVTDTAPRSPGRDGSRRVLAMPSASTDVTASASIPLFSAPPLHATQPRPRTRRARRP